MHELKLRRLHSRTEDEERDGNAGIHPRFSYASWVAAAVVGSGLIGAGTALYGANKQSQDNRAAQDQNARLQQDQNNAQWTNWLMTRGVAPTSPVTAGVMPTAGNYTATNTRLPLWANINLPTPRAAPTGAKVPFLVRKT